LFHRVAQILVLTHALEAAPFQSKAKSTQKPEIKAKLKIDFPAARPVPSVFACDEIEPSSTHSKCQKTGPEEYSREYFGNGRRAWVSLRQPPSRLEF